MQKRPQAELDRIAWRRRAGGRSRTDRGASLSYHVVELPARRLGRYLAARQTPLGRDARAAGQDRGAAAGGVNAKHPLAS